MFWAKQQLYSAVHEFKDLTIVDVNMEASSPSDSESGDISDTCIDDYLSMTVNYSDLDN